MIVDGMAHSLVSFHGKRKRCSRQDNVKYVNRIANVVNKNTTYYGLYFNTTLR